jgi:hypothetical protein
MIQLLLEEEESEVGTIERDHRGKEEKYSY